VAFELWLSTCARARSKEACMAMTSQAQWSGLSFEPFPAPELPGAEAGDSWASFVTEWATGTAQDESRRKPRQATRFEVLMTDPGWWETENPLPIRGECRNVSENGLYVVAPIGYGLAAGQRYVFHLDSSAGHDAQVSRYGTIVRTEVLLGKSDDWVGLGVHFDTPMN
jgi:hypothetical protein